jgi:hypothetical protein
MIVVPLLFFMFSLVSCSGSSEQPDEPDSNAESWTGTITLITRNTENVKSQYNMDRYIENDFLTETRMEASFESGKGHATHSNRLERRNLVRDKISVSRTTELITTERGSSSGSGPSDLSIGIDEESKTYSIEATIPEAKGSTTTSYACKGCLGVPETQTVESFGEATFIQTDIQKLGENPDVLTGEIREEHEEGDITSLMLIQWSFVRGPLDAELIVTPENYDSWLPVPGRSETEKGNQIPVNLKVQGKGGKKSRLKAKQFIVELRNTSKEPGIALNAPLNVVGPPKPDMRIDGASDSEGQTLTIPCENGATGTFAINAFDGGARSVLSVTAVLEGGIRIRGHLLKPEGITEITLPKQTGNSVIADVWKKQYKVTSDEDDFEALPGNSFKGDGLSAYEEYRGFFSEGKFRRLNPQKMELGVQVMDKDKTTFAPGLQLFTKATGIDIFVLNDQELATDRRLNRNASTANVYPQFALRMERADGESGVAGYNEPKDKLKKLPKDSERIVINVAHHDANFREQDAGLKKHGLTIPFTAEQNLASTIAHEMGHAVSLDHHGPPSNEPERRVPKDAPKTFHIYNYFGQEDHTRPYEIDGIIGVPGNEESGDISCIMGYTNQYDWAHLRAADGALIYKQVPVLPVGERVCSSAAGTGINANGDFFGNATNGNCQSRIKLRD